VRLCATRVVNINKMQPAAIPSAWLHGPICMPCGRDYCVIDDGMPKEELSMSEEVYGLPRGQNRV
jgi:hypothetical protein